MRRGFHVVVLGALLAGAQLSCAPAPSRLTEADVTAVRQVTEDFVKGVQGKNWAAVAGLYVEDATLMPPNPTAVKGRSAI